jgi:hypothetical protein
MRLGSFRPFAGILAATHSLWREVQRFRQRCVRRRTLAVIRRSELFDAAWYLAQNPDVAQLGVDPARHYMLHGWLEGRNPSPLFDGREYLSRHPELYGQGVNPLLHHLQVVLPEERLPPLSRPWEAADAAAMPNGAFAAPELPKPWRQGSHAEPASGRNGHALGEAILGYGAATAREIIDVHRHIDWLLWLCRQDTATTTDDPGKADDRTPAPGGPQPAALRPSEILNFAAAGAPRIDDAWWVGSRCLRVRLTAADTNPLASIVTGLQWDPIGQSHVLDETAVGSVGMAFLDVHLTNPFLPILLVLTTPAGDIRASTIVPFPSLCRGGLHHGESLLAPDAAPGLEAVRRTSDRLITAWTAVGGRPSLDRIEVDLSHATGSERVFSPDLRAWLGDVLGISVCPGDEARASDGLGPAWLHAAIRVDAARRTAAPRADAGEPRVLRLTHDAIPTLHVLLGPAGRRTGLAPFILGGGMSGDPAWVITPPCDELPLETHQPQAFGPFPRLVGAGHAGATSPAPADPAALRFTSPMRLQAADLQAPFAAEMSVDRILPHLPHGGDHPARVTAVLAYGGDPDRAAAQIEALALQVDTSWDQILLLTDTRAAAAAAAAVRRGAPLCGEVVVHAVDTPLHVRFNQAAARATGDMLLVLGGDVLLHERRAVAYLARLLASPRIASTTCMLITGGTGATVEYLDVVGCGALDAALPRRRANFSHLRLVDSLVGLPPSVWPVAANSPDLFLVRRRDWVDRGGFEPSPDGADPLTTSFWDACRAAGLLHVASTAMSATGVAADAVRARPAPVMTAGDATAMSVRRIVA